MRHRSRNDLERLRGTYQYSNVFLNPLNMQFGERFGMLKRNDVTRLLDRLKVRRLKDVNKFFVDDVIDLMFYQSSKVEKAIKTNELPSKKQEELPSKKIENDKKTSVKQTEDDIPYDKFFDKTSLDKWYRPKNIRLSESQYNRLFEGIEWTVNDNHPNLTINSKSDDKSNLKGKLNADTRMFGNAVNIMNGDGTSHGKTKTLAQNAMSKQAQKTAYINLIQYIKNGRKGQIFTDANVDSYTKTTIAKWLSDPTLSDQDIINKAKMGYGRINLASQVYMNKYNRVQDEYNSGNIDNVARYSIFKIPETQVECIALFSMKDFNFSDALKHGNIRQNDKTNDEFGLSADTRFADRIPVTYDYGIEPNVSQNFSLYNIGDNGDHFKNSYNLQKYYGSKPVKGSLPNYTTINQFLDKSIMYAAFVLKKEEFMPDYIVTVPSSSMFNHFYATNLSNKLGVDYVEDFFRKDLLNVRFNGDDLYERLSNDGFKAKEISTLDTKLKSLWMSQLENEMKQPISRFVRQYANIFMTLSKVSHGREKFTLDEALENFAALCYDALRNEDVYGDILARHLVDNFYNLKIYNNNVKSTILHSLKTMITLKIGKKNLGGLLAELKAILSKNIDYLKNQGVALDFKRRNFKITQIDKRFRNYLTGMYIIADENLNQNGELFNRFKRGNILIIDEDINSGASFRLCIDALAQKVPTIRPRQIMCLANGFSDSGR